MGRSDTPMLRGTWLGQLLHWWNPVMRRLLASPLHVPWSRWFVLLAWTGRRTGQRRTTPVSYVVEDTVLFVTTGDRWWHNFTPDGDVRVCHKGRWRRARAVPVTDAEQSRQEHQRLLERHAWFRRLAGIPAAADGRPDEDALARSIAAGRTLIRIELTSREDTQTPDGGSR